MDFQGCHTDYITQAELCDPKTYEGFSKEDWEDLRSTLPDDVPLNPDGYSISTHFLKYNPDFRRGVREFQEDLGAGRLDPKWQAAAAQAMEERARGDFDDWKEKEFEEFWGQKQKLSTAVLAGESTNLKLEVMVENGLFRVGDEITFCRTIGKGDNRVWLDKECKVSSKSSGCSVGNIADTTQIIIVTQKTMTLAIPSQRAKFLPPGMKVEEFTQPKLKVEEQPKKGKESVIANEEEAIVPIAANGDERSAVDPGPEGNDVNLELPEGEPVLGNFDLSWKEDSKKTDPGSVSDSVLESSSNHSPEAFVLLEISNLKQLMDKIIELDGRLDPKNQKEAPAISPWKLMRAKRNNQDLGSLFEMREDFYVYKLPYITKKGKGKK